jgi:hypothetical protein
MTMPVVKAFTIKIISVEYAGRYVGMQFGGGLVTNPDVKRIRLSMPGANYGLWAQERATTRFFEANAAPVLRELNRLGYKTQLIKVQG